AAGGSAGERLAQRALDGVAFTTAGVNQTVHFDVRYFQPVVAGHCLRFDGRELIACSDRQHEQERHVWTHGSSGTAWKVATAGGHRDGGAPMMACELSLHNRLRAASPRSGAHRPQPESTIAGAAKAAAEDRRPAARVSEQTDAGKQRQRTSDVV